MNRPQLGRDVFARGEPEPIAEIKRPRMDGDALRFAFRLRRSSARSRRDRFVRVRKRTVWSLAEAREALERLIGAEPWIGARSINISSPIWPSLQCTPPCWLRALLRRGRDKARQQQRAGGRRAA